MLKFNSPEWQTVMNTRDRQAGQDVLDIWGALLPVQDAGGCRPSFTNRQFINTMPVKNTVPTDRQRSL